eukprot:g1085.t1
MLPRNVIIAIVVVLAFLMLVQIEESHRGTRRWQAPSSAGDDVAGSGHEDGNMVRTTNYSDAETKTDVLPSVTVSGANTSTLAILTLLGGHLNNSTSRVRNMTGSLWGTWTRGNATIYSNITTNSAATSVETSPPVIGVTIGVPESSVAECTLSQGMSEQFSQVGGSLQMWITEYSPTEAFKGVIEISGMIYISSSSQWNALSYVSWPFRGLYFPNTGQLTAFTNPKNYPLYVRGRALQLYELESVKVGNFTLATQAYTPVMKLRSEIAATTDKMSHRRSSLGSWGSHSKPILRLDGTAFHLTEQVVSHTSESNRLSAGQISINGSLTAPFNKPMLGSSSTIKKLPLFHLKIQASGYHIDFDKILADAAFYGFLETVACAIQVGFHIRLVKALQGPTSQRATSEVTFFILAAADLVMCVVHFLLGTIFDRLFSWFAIIALFKFMLFSIEFKLIFQIWRARRPQEEATGPSAQRWRKRVYARFYCTLLLALAVVYQLMSVMLPASVFLLSSFLFPQVFANLYFDAPRALLPVQRTFFMASATRLFIPFYMWGVGSGLVRLFPVGKEAIEVFGKTDSWLLFFIVSWFGVQFAIFEWQYRTDNMLRQFVPKILLPSRHNYRPVFTSEDIEYGGILVTERGPQEGIRQCAICMNSVDIALDPSGLPGYMVTPCGHWFHAGCLTRWFETGSLNCPVCRQECPPEIRGPEMHSSIP